jgi:hypothetical protein
MKKEIEIKIVINEENIPKIINWIKKFRNHLGIDFFSWSAKEIKN